MARIVKKYDYPMVLNIVIHRKNIDQMRDILDMTVELNADYVELASTQYYGLETDLEELIQEARHLGYYTNLITSGVGMDEARVKRFKDAGLETFNTDSTLHWIISRPAKNRNEH